VQQKFETVETLPTDVRAAATDEILTEELLPPQDLDTELAELATSIEASATRKKNDANALNKTNMKQAAIVLAPLVLALVGSLVAMMRDLVSPAAAMWIAIASLFWAIITGVFTLPWKPKNPSTDVEEERLTTQRLVAIDDVRAVPLLLDALRWHTDRTLRPELWKALGRLLPRLTAAQAHALGPGRLRRMAFWIHSWNQTPRHSSVTALGTPPIVGILHVLAHSDQGSYRFYHPASETAFSVLTIAKTWAAGHSLGKNPEVRQAAIACCEVIKTRKEQARSSAQLLRASAPASSAPDSLLRPAQGVQETAPEELLRATSPTPHDDDHA